MPTINDYRNKFPSLRELDDTSLIARVAEVQGVPVEDVMAHMGYKPKARGMLSALNDTVIEFGNAAAGFVKSVGDFVKPGNPVSEFIDQNIIRAGEANQSDVVKAEKARYRSEMEGAEGIGDEVGSTLGYVARNPLLSVAQAAGSFVAPGAAIKGAGMLSGLAGLGAKGTARAGLAGGAVAGAALSGGDAAGTAYELVKKAGGTDEEATEAARKASVLPAAIGAAGGVIGAERLFAGAGGFKGGMVSRALKTAGVEGAQEAVEEGVTQYEGQAAAAPFDPSIDPTKGVAGAAVMGGVLGGATGAGVSLLSGEPAQAKKPGVVDVLAAPSVDDAINTAMQAVSAPAVKPRKANEAAAAELAMLDPADRAEALSLMQVAERQDVSGNVRRFAQNRLDALLAPIRTIPTGEVTEMLPVADARELTDEERAEYANAAPFSYRRAMERGLPQPEVTELVPAGDATELETIPVGDASEPIPTAEAYETLPTGEADELIPTADATEVEAVPAGEASELDVETIQPGDLMAKDGEPFTSKTGAQAKAYASGGGKVVTVPNHFGAGQPGYVVRPLMPARPNNTRGTNANDVARPDGQRPADAGRGERAGVLPDSGPGDVLPSPEGAAGQGVAGPGAAGGGNGRTNALTTQTGAGVIPGGLRVTFGGKTYPVESVEDAQRKWEAFRDSADGGGPAGVSQVGNGIRVTDGAGRFVARISYNGRVWDTEDTGPMAAPSPAPAAPTPALTEGQRVTLKGEPYTVVSATPSAVKLQGADGGTKMVATNSKTYGQIQRLGERETITPAEDTVVGKNDAGETLYERKDGSRYRMRFDSPRTKPNGYPDFGGDLSPVEASPAPRTEAPAPTAATATEAPAAGTGRAAGVEADGVKPRKTLQEARADAALDKQVRENGEVMTRRQWVERKVAEGLKTKVTQEDRIKPMSRMAYFRANNEEQRAHDRKVKEAGKKDVFWIGDYEVTKTEHDYANALTAEKAATPNAAAPASTQAPAQSVGAPAAAAPEAERYAAGRALTKEQRKQVLESLVDVYKAKGADREMKGQGRDGNERYGYVHSPELFEKSDITGAMVRYYVTLPDGRRAHPSELFPDYTQADVDAALAKREADEKADRDNQAWAEGQAEKFGKATIADAEASWKERNKGIAGRDPLRDWRTGQQYTLVTLEKGGQFYSVRNDDAALMGRLERAGWKRAEAAPTAALTPKAQAVKAMLGADKPLDALAAKLDGPEMSARRAFTGGRRVVRVVNLKQTNSALIIVADGDGFKVVVDNDMSGGLREKIAARLAEMSAGNVAADIAPATHKDPGEPAEPVTPAVVREAIKTGVQDTGRKPSAMRAELLAEIDRAIEEAPDYGDYQAFVKSMGQKDGAAVMMERGEIGAPPGYSRPKRTFKVEGDGVFTIQNSVRQLLKFRAQVEKSPGFKDRQAPGGLNERATDALDRRSTDAAIANMVEEGDFQAALDYAEAKEVDIGAVKLSKLLRDRLEKWQKDQASAKAVAEYEDARAEGKPAPGSLAAAFAEKEAEAAPAPAAEPEADDIPEAGIASQTFDQWVRAKYAGNEYKARYLEEFGGDERRAILGAAIGTIDNDRKTPDLLREAKDQYRRDLFALPREAAISMEVYDALTPVLQNEAIRHFYDLSSRITRRTQDETKARVEAERIKKAPYEAAFAEVDAEIRRLDAIPGPETQKQKDLSARRDRLREALYQIGQGKEPDGRLLRKVDDPEPLDLKGFTRTPRGNGAFDLSDGNMRVSVEPTERGKFQARFGSAKSSPHLQGEQAAVDWAAQYRKDATPAPAAPAPQAAATPDAAAPQALTQDAIPKSLQITLELEGEDGKTQKKLVNARKAHLAASQRVEKLRALKECIG